jgi:drug/metabolite transporter (DMT)-like permease
VEPTEFVIGKIRNPGIVLSLLFAVFLWGGNNTGTRYIVHYWPPVWTGASRFFCAGIILLGLLRFTRWLGPMNLLDREIQSRLWWRGGLSLAAYIVSFNWAVRFTAVSHVVLYLGAAPVWALLWEGWPGMNRLAVKRYGAAALALGGVFVLLWPTLKGTGGSLPGELLGLTASLLWTNYGRQCRSVSARLSGAEISAHTMCRAGVLLMPFAAVELARGGLPWRGDVALVQGYCIIAGGVAAFGIWNNALRHWPASQVLLFNTLIPLSTMGWARVWLGEPVSPTFWVAMVLVATGVLLGQVGAGQNASPQGVGGGALDESVEAGPSRLERPDCN